VFNGKSVFVSGGTGSFGRKFANILLERYDLARLVFYSRDELKQFEMQQEVNAPCIRWLIGDVRDGARLIEATRGIDYLVHAAAMKQVTASEYNPMECIRTNIHGAENIVAAALANDVEQVVALSSDKAANPINLYGATKLAADKLFIAANNMAGKRRTAFSVVRYGNVAGSRGSVVPFFEKLIAQGATSLPITDTDMTRFWTSLQESVDFVLKCFHAWRRDLCPEVAVDPDSRPCNGDGAAPATELDWYPAGRKAA
jgi:UDP-N-acetylglucosamine 4,6-dehydratase/5-epimerase